MRNLLLSVLVLITVMSANAYAADAAPADATSLDASSPDAATGADAGPLDSANVATPDDVEKYGGEVYDAVKTSNWKWLATLLTIGLVWLIRWLGTGQGGKPPKVKQLAWASTARGGAILSFLWAAIITAASAYKGGADLSLKMLLGALMLAWSASGGWSWLKAVIKGDKVPS